MQCSIISTAHVRHGHRCAFVYPGATYTFDFSLRELTESSRCAYSFSLPETMRRALLSSISGVYPASNQLSRRQVVALFSVQYERVVWP